MTPENQNVPVCGLAVAPCSAMGATATPMTDREDKVIRHYCDISWQERYDLMREHACTLEREAAQTEMLYELAKGFDLYGTGGDVAGCIREMLRVIHEQRAALSSPNIRSQPHAEDNA